MWMVDWNRWQNIYIFPPSAMLPRILDRLLNYRGQAVIVARVSLLHPLYPVATAKLLHGGALSSSPSVSDGRTFQGQGYRTLILSMDRLSFLKNRYLQKWSEPVTVRLLQAYRPSTIKQQQVVWNSFQDWLRQTGEDISDNSLMKFFFYLRDSRQLETTTILNYKSALHLPSHKPERYPLSRVRESPFH